MGISASRERAALSDARPPNPLDHFQPHTPGFAQNPYPIYERMQAHQSPLYYAPFDTWLVSRFADVARLARDPNLRRTPGDWCTQQQRQEQLQRDNWHDMPYHSRFVQFSLLDSDGEVHDRLRRQVFNFFAPGPVAKLRTVVEARANQQLNDLLSARQPFDFVSQLAADLPGYMIGKLMGVPDEDCALLRLWSERIVQFFDVDRSTEKKVLAEATTKEFYDYLIHLRRLRRRQPADDLITQLLQAESAGLLTEDEFISTCMLIVMAGHGSTQDALGNGLYALLRHPEQLQRLREEPTLVKSAVQEMLRFESPLPFFHRFNSTPISLGGQTFPVGTRFGLLYGAANRDEAAFENAARFDIARHPNRHLALGGGAHFCLGNHLARLNMEVLLGCLLQHSARISLAQDSVHYKLGLSARGLQTLFISVN